MASSTVFANLAPLIRTGSPAIAQYLVAAVSRGDLDLLTIQRDLEAENIEWSNAKIDRTLSALRGLMQKHNMSMTDEEQQALVDEMTQKCISTKQSQAVIEAIAGTVNSQHKAAEEVRSVLRLQELVDF